VPRVGISARRVNRRSRASAGVRLGHLWLTFHVRHRDSFVATQPSDAAMKVAAPIHRVVRSLRLELAHRAHRLDRRSDRLAFVIAAAADRRMCGVDPGAGAGCVDVARPRAGPSRMMRLTDMKTSPNQPHEPTETSSCRGSIRKGASRVASCLRGSAHRSAQGFIHHPVAI
jgi:hypothetical protein